MVPRSVVYSPIPSCTQGIRIYKLRKLQGTYNGNRRRLSSQRDRYGPTSDKGLCPRSRRFGVTHLLIYDHVLGPTETGQADSRAPMTKTLLFMSRSPLSHLSRGNQKTRHDHHGYDSSTATDRYCPSCGTSYIVKQSVQTPASA